jgi:fructose-1,6-bisphosphatase/inositol monophosphatase family enzyme
MIRLLDPKGYAMYRKLRPKISGFTLHLDFLVVLDGAIDGIVVYKSDGQIWDYAPRAHLIKEAGGLVANIGKSTYDIHDLDLVATNAVIFDEVHKILSDIA